MIHRLQKLLLLLLGVVFMTNQFIEASEKPFRYIITETAGPSSFDPLDADSTSNLPVARMIYATPLETSETNQLSSRVLESFRYNAEKKQIEWIVKSNIKYEDGTLLTTEDVAFAVTRMAFTRPQFPVIEEIEGVDVWAKSKDALKKYPKGISVSNNKIVIQFKKDVSHPLFRFCLELFSIIPKRCVDLSTNKISCNKIPESGQYKIVSQNPTQILFAKRGNNESESIPPLIQFEYNTPSELSKGVISLDNKTVVAGNESFFTPAQISEIENKLTIRYTPAARFSVIQINQNIPPFDDKGCREIFAHTFRNAYHELAKTAPIEGSIFTKILPGYLSLKELGPSYGKPTEEISFCKSKLSKATIPWGYAETEKDLIFFKALKLTFKILGIKETQPITRPTRKEFSDIFANNKVAFFNAGSGFWALDPSGDMKMLFTPNLHKPLRHVTSDEKLQMLIEMLDQNSEAYKEVNKYLYNDAKFNVYTHLRRFFVAKNESLLGEIPFAITSPAPWQVFKVK